MQLELTVNAIEEKLQKRQFSALRALTSDREPADVAAVVEDLAPDARALMIRVLPRQDATELFEHLQAETQENLVHAMADEQLSAILNEMAPDERTQMLEEMPAAMTRKILSLLTQEERAIARRLLGYPDDSIGRLMTPDVLSVRSHWTVEQTLRHIREIGPDVETLNVLYIVDDAGLLVDDLRIRQLLLAHPDTQITDLGDGHAVALSAMDDQETAIQVFKEYDRVALPVTDSGGVMLGIVTHDDVLDIAEEEATEDIQKIGGSEALEQPYLRIGFFEMTRKRAVWLVALFFGQLLTMNALGAFHEQLAEMAVLMLFVPLIMSSGGNSGSQAATLVIRAMTLEEVELADWWKVVRRELIFGLLLGTTVALIGFARVYFGGSMGEPLLADNWLRIGLAVSLSLVAVVVWGVVIGSMLPFVMKRLGADPAASSTPFVTTIVDVTAIVIYLYLATAIL